MKLVSNEAELPCRQIEGLDPFYRVVWEKALKEGIPISGTFELTPRCNFNCRMCYVHLKEQQIHQRGKELSAGEWLHIAEEAKKEGTTWLCITGGEPLLHPEFSDIWKGLAEMGFFLTLQTNASLIAGNIAELLEKYPPRQVKVTLYGTNNRVYQDVCGVENGFSRVNEGIHILLSMGIPVSLVSTMIRQNEDDAEKMAFYAYRHGLTWRTTGNVKASLRGAETDVSALRITGNSEEHKALAVEKRIKGKKFLDPGRKPCTYCRDYRVGYWVLWDGHMSFCSFMDVPDISIKQMSFKECWRQLLEYEEALDWPSECKMCEANKVCLECIASLATESGGSLQMPKGYCDKIRELYKRRND